MSLIGLPLETARALLEAQGIKTIIVRETMPPRAEKASGPWRVLRFQMSEDGHCEIVAAREQMREQQSEQQREATF